MRGVCCWSLLDGTEGGQKIEYEEMLVGVGEVEEREGGGDNNGGAGETSKSAASA